MTAEQAQGLSDVIDYAAQTDKTQLSDEHAEIMRRFVTGVNCRAETAREEMMAVKAHYSKTDSVVAYHGYQSFALGEATPEMAHEIGVKLAERLWGDQYQVLVTTHLDKAHHLHNHFVLNNVSMTDGKKYYRSNSDYYHMQQQSDALCLEYGLSVIEQPQRGQSKHYGEWKAEQDGRQTWRGMVKSDVDAAIRQSMTERQFWDALHKIGYEVKRGKNISVRPPGKERFVRLRRNFGDDYTIEAIRRRILAQTRPERNTILADPPPKKVRINGTFRQVRKVTGLRALYFNYLYRMGVFPKKRQPNPNRVYFLFREDIRHMQSIARETRLLVKYSIDTDVQLAAHKDGLTAQITALSGQRKKLRNKTRSIKDEGELAAVKSEITILADSIGALRREVRLCESIEKCSVEMKVKLRQERQDEKSSGKEQMKHEPLRRRR
jgi:hypothetical protein